MNRKVILIIVIGSLIFAWGMITIGGLKVSRGEESLSDKASIEEYVESILPWETVISKIPKLAGYGMDESTSIKGKPSHVTIASDSPLLWRCSREVSEDGVDVPGGFHSFEILIGFWENEASLQEEIKRNSEWGFEIQEGQVTTGFFEEKAPFGDGRDRNLLEVFAAKGRLKVRLAAITYFDGSEGESLAERADLEKLIEIVKERLLAMD